MLVAVIGVTQGCGKLIVASLARRGVRVKALARTPSKAENVLTPELTPDQQKLVGYAALDVTSDVDAIASALQDSSAVIFAASGSHKKPFGLGVNHPQSPQFVDYLGAKKVAEACVKINIKRYVLLSAFDADRGFFWANFMLNALFSNVIMFKAKGEEALRTIFKDANEKLGQRRSKKFTYAIVRPGGLRNRKPAGPGYIKVGGRINGSIGISRGDVAEICVECAVDNSPVDCTFDCTQFNGQPKDGCWMEKGKRIPQANSWKELLENVESWESIMAKKDEKK